MQWPTPADGNIRVSLGRRHASFVTSPSYSLGARPVSDTVTGDLGFPTVKFDLGLITEYLF